MKTDLLTGIGGVVVATDGSGALCEFADARVDGVAVVFPEDDSSTDRSIFSSAGLVAKAFLERCPGLWIDPRLGQWLNQLVIGIDATQADGSDIRHPHGRFQLFGESLSISCSIAIEHDFLLAKNYKVDLLTWPVRNSPTSFYSTFS